MKIKICVNHLHNGNDPNGSRRRLVLERVFNYEAHKGRPYVTVARAIDLDTKEELVWDAAVCSNKDQPNRKLGYRIAVGRVKKTLKELRLA
jgi:hypothetical protein